MDESRNIFDSAERLSAYMQAHHQIREVRKQLSEALSTCGSCLMWMTPTCPREVHCNARGTSRGPSCRDLKCDRFILSSVSAKSAAVYEAKISELQQQRLHAPL